MARGFTLVELLVALLVTALLGVMSWRGIDGMLRSQAITRTHADDLMVLQSGLAQWGADLDAVVTQSTTAMDWNGNVLRLTRTANDAGQPGLQVVAWSARLQSQEPQWWRWQSPVVHTGADLQQAWTNAAQWGQGQSTGSTGNAVAIVPLQNWQIYFFRSGAWSNAQSSADGANSAPDGVRLQLDLAPGMALSGRVTRDWVRATLAGNKS